MIRVFLSVPRSRSGPWSEVLFLYLFMINTLGPQESFFESIRTVYPQGLRGRGFENSRGHYICGTMLAPKPPLHFPSVSAFFVFGTFFSKGRERCLVSSLLLLIQRYLPDSPPFFFMPPRPWTNQLIDSLFLVTIIFPILPSPFLRFFLWLWIRLLANALSLSPPPFPFHGVEYLIFRNPPSFSCSSISLETSVSLEEDSVCPVDIVGSTE